MKRTSSMAPRIRRQQARIAIFAASLERQNRCQGCVAGPEEVPRRRSGEVSATSRSAAIRCRVCGADQLHGKWKSELLERLKHYSEFGDIMDDFTSAAELAQVTQKSPV